MSIKTQRHTNIEKSPSDDRDYLGLTLANKLKVVLVKDTRAELSSAAMSVYVGNLKDPKEFMGIAHFLEHMLFIGSEKYPEDSTYKKFIINNGGSCNASTSSTSTQYYFSIKCEKLLEALDIFAQFFISPLLSDDCTNREVNAVDSEASKNYNQDSRRKYQLSRHLSNHDSVYNKFGTGNLATLNKPGLRDALKAFHEQYYSSDIMSLAIYHNGDIEELAVQIEALFSHVPNKDIGKITYPGESHPFSEDKRNRLIQFIPVLNKHSLHLTFQLDDLSTHKEKRPLSYIGHILGHECKGSLANHLISEGYCLSLSSGGSTMEGLFSSMAISIDLTDKGLANIDYILDATGAYLSFLRHDGIHEWIYEECKAISEISFKFKNKLGPVETVKAITDNLDYYGIDSCLSGNYQYGSFDRALVTGIFDELIAKNLQVFYSSQEIKQSDCTLEEPIYKTRYSIKDIEEKTQKNMSLKWDDVNVKFKKVFSLPRKNDLIPKNTDIVPILTSAENPQNPEIILNDEKVILYHMLETSFHAPKAVCWIQVADNTLNHYGDRRTDILYSLWTRVLTHVFRSEKYYFSLAMANLAVSHERYGLGFEISGYSDTISAAASRLVEQCQLVNQFDDKDQFYRIKEKLAKQYENALKSQPSSTANFRLDELLKNYTMSFEEYLAATKGITWQQFVEFRDTVFRAKIKFTCFVGGNMSKENSTDLIKSFVEKFTDLYKPLAFMKPQDFADFRVVQLPPKKTFIFRKTNVVETEDNNAMMIYYQMGDYRHRRSELNFIASYLKQKYFYELRTKQQLGYVVSSGVSYVKGIYGFCMTVQSNHKSADYCRLKTDEFIAATRSAIRQMADSEFDDIVQGMLSQVRRPYSNIYEITSSRLSQISTNMFEYDIRRNKQLEIAALTRDAVVQCYDRLFDADRCRLEIHVVSRAMLAASNDDLCDRLAACDGMGDKTEQSSDQTEDIVKTRDPRLVEMLNSDEPLVEVNERYTLINDATIFKRMCSLFPDFERKKC